MALPIEKRILAWVILIVCVAAVPVSLFVRQGRDAQKEVEERANSLRVLLPRQDRILVVRLYDMIMDDDPDSLLSPRGSAGDAKKQLRKAVEDKHVKAVLFRINSPEEQLPPVRSSTGWCRQSGIKASPSLCPWAI